MPGYGLAVQSFDTRGVGFAAPWRCWRNGSTC